MGVVITGGIRQLLRSASGFCSPSIRLMSVVFPEPDGPVQSQFLAAMDR